MYELVKVLNKQGVELDGLFYNTDTKICVLHIPGFGGTLEGLPQNIGAYFQNNNIAYLCGLNQGSFPEHKFKQYYRIETQRECRREESAVIISQRECHHRHRCLSYYSRDFYKVLTELDPFYNLPIV